MANQAPALMTCLYRLVCLRQVGDMLVEIQGQFEGVLCSIPARISPYWTGPQATTTRVGIAAKLASWAEARAALEQARQGLDMPRQKKTGCVMR